MTLAPDAAQGLARRRPTPFALPYSHMPVALQREASPDAPRPDAPWVKEEEDWLLPAATTTGPACPGAAACVPSADECTAINSWAAAAQLGSACNWPAAAAGPGGDNGSYGGNVITSGHSLGCSSADGSSVAEPLPAALACLWHPQPQRPPHDQPPRGQAAAAPCAPLLQHPPRAAPERKSPPPPDQAAQEPPRKRFRSASIFMGAQAPLAGAAGAPSAATAASAAAIAAATPSYAVLASCGSGGEAEGSEVAFCSRLITCKTYLKRLNITAAMAEHLLPCALAPSTANVPGAAAAADGYQRLYCHQIQLRVVEDGAAGAGAAPAAAAAGAGGSHVVQYEGIVCNKQRHARFTAGWCEFARCQSLAIGDRLVFERRGADRNTLYVRIQRGAVAVAAQGGSGGGGSSSPRA